MWLGQVRADPEMRRADLLYSRIPAMLGAGLLSPIPFASDHYRPWPDELPVILPVLRAASRRRTCAGFILHSEFAAQAYRRASVDDRLILVAHNGADPPAETLSKAAARARLGLDEARPIALYAGRINGEKGLDQILALARIRPDVLFLLVGGEGDGPIQRDAAAIANVRIVDWVEPASLPIWLQAADLLIIPPSSAPLQCHRNCVLPMKLFAYLAAGRPIVAPHAPDTAELLAHEENALLVPPDNVEAASAAVDRLLRDAALAERLGEKARRLSAELTWDRRAERVSQFLESRLAAMTAGRPASHVPAKGSPAAPRDAGRPGYDAAPTSAGSGSAAPLR
jgi:glycosyltransferase involved in cell wall biosynthesis